MIRILKRLDAIIVIIIFTIMIGSIVITMRSKTYSIGYEIALLKAKEKNLTQKQIELQAELASTKRTVRNGLLSQKNKEGKPRFVFPDPSRVTRLQGL